MNRSTASLPRAMAIAMALVLCIAPAVFASNTFTLSPSGNGVYRLQGADMKGVSAMDVVLQYDTTTLANPRIEKGPLLSGAMMEANPKTPGIVRVAIIRIAPIEGNGTLLTFTFDRKNNSPGRITGLDVKVADTNGPLQASVITEDTAVAEDAQDTAAVAADTSSPQGGTTPQSTAASPTMPKITAPSSISLGMKAKDNCWVQVKADGKVVFQGVLKKGRFEHWQAKEKIELSLGNAGVVELEVNDKNIASLGRKGQVLKNILITRSGLSTTR